MLVGIAGYVTNIGVFAALLAAGLRYVPDAIISFFVANSLMYLGNRYFTFRLGRAGIWAAYGRYVLVGSVIALMNLAVLAALVEGAGLDSRVGLAISLLLLTPLAFVLFKRWAFRAGSPAG